MASGDRTKAILGKATYFLGKDFYNQPGLLELAYDIISDCQRKLAEETKCLEGTTTYSVVAEQESYAEPSGYYRLNNIALPSGQYLPLIEIDEFALDRLKKLYVTGSPQAPLYFCRWNGNIIFYPAPKASGTYTMNYWKTPTTTPSASVDPEIPSMFDTALYYNLIAELAPAEVINKPDIATLYLARYEQEKRRALEAWRGTKSQHYRVYSSEAGLR